MFREIEGSEEWLSIEKIAKGWSSDEKYIVITKDDKKLLRISTIEAHESKLKEFEIISKYAQTGIPMSLPLAMGICDDGRRSYMLLTWIEGQELNEVLPTLNEEEQYLLGRSAGRILRKIHSIDLNAEDIPPQTKASRKLKQLGAYERSDVRYTGDERAIAFVKEHIHAIWQEEPVYLHGDFHPGNLIYREDGSLGVIDFNRWEVGDPYEEFYKLESFGVEVSVPYCVGQIDAYFGAEVPEQFWVTLAIYVAHASLHSILWAVRFGADEIVGMERRCRRAFVHYDGFRRMIPTWYEDWHRSH